MLVLNTLRSLYTHALGFYLILEIIYKEKLPQKKKFTVEFKCLGFFQLGKQVNFDRGQKIGFDYSKASAH